jgi:hypothetical protein
MITKNSRRVDCRFSSRRKRLELGSGVFLSVLLIGLLPGLVAGTNPNWQTLAPGMELTYVSTDKPRPAGDSRIVVLRIDPKLWELSAMGVSQTGESAGHTARTWSEKHKLVAAINAGMFETDQRTHLGYMRSGGHIYSGHQNKYQSVAAFDPRDSKDIPRFHIFDLDSPGVTFESIRQNYESAIQNLRLVKRPGSNQWAQQDKKWSEAALGEDDAGRILFIFSRSPFSMHDLNQVLLAAGVGLVAAQHLEGGPEAQLYLHVSGFELEMFGSYESAFRENDTNSIPWPIPNVLGVRPRSSPSQ